MQLAPPPTLSDLTADAHAGSFLHDYLQSVYREHLPKVVHGGASGFIWFYHRLVGLNVSCRQPQTWRFQRSLCCPPLNSSASLCALHRDQPQPVTPLNRWGYWLPTLALPRATWTAVATGASLRGRRYLDRGHPTRARADFRAAIMSALKAASTAAGFWRPRAAAYLSTRAARCASSTGRRSQYSSACEMRLLPTSSGSQAAYRARQLFDEYPYCFENVFDLCSLVRLRLAPAVYDTIQIWEERYSQRKSHRGDGRLFELEVISCDDGCVSMPPKAFAGPCVPIPMRTGWKADKHCACNDTIDVLNCVDTAPHISLPSPTLEPDKHGNKSIIKSHELSAFQALPLCTSIFHRAWLP